MPVPVGSSSSVIRLPKGLASMAEIAYAAKVTQVLIGPIDPHDFANSRWNLPEEYQQQRMYGDDRRGPTMHLGPTFHPSSDITYPRFWKAEPLQNMNGSYIDCSQCRPDKPISMAVNNRPGMQNEISKGYHIARTGARVVFPLEVVAVYSGDHFAQVFYQNQEIKTYIFQIDPMHLQYGKDDRRIIETNARLRVVVGNDPSRLTWDRNFNYHGHRYPTRNSDREGNDVLIKLTGSALIPQENRINCVIHIRSRYTNVHSLVCIKEDMDFFIQEMDKGWKKYYSICIQIGRRLNPDLQRESMDDQVDELRMHMPEYRTDEAPPSSATTATTTLSQYYGYKHGPMSEQTNDQEPGPEIKLAEQAVAETQAQHFEQHGPAHDAREEVPQPDDLIAALNHLETDRPWVAPGDIKSRQHPSTPEEFHLPHIPNKPVEFTNKPEFKGDFDDMTEYMPLNADARLEGIVDQKKKKPPHLTSNVSRVLTSRGNFQEKQADDVDGSPSTSDGDAQ